MCCSISKPAHRPVPVPQVHVYQRLVPMLDLKPDSRHFATPPLIITWGENVRNLSLIFDHTRLWAALVCKVSEIYKVQRERLSPNWCSWLSTSENGRLQKRGKKLCSIISNQLCITRLCGNLRCWCIMGIRSQRIGKNTLLIKSKMADCFQIF